MSNMSSVNSQFGGAAMKIVVRGSNLFMDAAVAKRLVSQLPKRGIALWELPVESAGRVLTVRLPVSRRAVRVYNLSDGRVLVKPQGDFAFIWRVVLGQGKGVQQLRDFFFQRGTAKKLRQLEVDGVLGPGGSLPLRFWTGESSDYPQFSVGSPVWKYVQALESVYGVRPVVSEVGLTVEAAARLARVFGFRGDDDRQAAAALAAACWSDEALIVLRRMPLTDPMTGFVVALPVVVDASSVRGDMIWIPPDVALLLYGDEDGDRYYVDAVAGHVATREVSDVEQRMFIRPLRAFGSQPVSAPAFLADPESQVKHTGLRGAAALAGVLASAGVGPLFYIVYRIAASVAMAGFKREAGLISSFMMRVFEPLFDARKRLVSGQTGAVDPVTGESVPAYSLPYVSAIVRATRAQYLSDVRGVLNGLAEALLSDADEDARVVGGFVASAVSVIDEVLAQRDVPLGLDAEVGQLELRDIDLFAMTAATAPLTGELTKPSVRPVLTHVEGGDMSREGPEVLVMTDRELRHTVGGESYVGYRIPLVFKRGVLVTRELQRLAQLDLSALLLLKLQQRVPTNQINAQELERDGLRWASGALLNDPYGNQLQTVTVADGERIMVFGDVPVVEDGGVLRVDTGLHRLPKDRVLHDMQLFKIGLGRVERDGAVWYRWHLLMVAADKVRGVSVTGKQYMKSVYHLVSVVATPWFDADPESIVSGCRILQGDGDRIEWLPGRFDAYVSALEGSELVVRAAFMTPPVSLLAAMLGGLLNNLLGVYGTGSSALRSAVYGLFGQPVDQPTAVFGSLEGVAVQRSVRQVVRHCAAQALPIRDELALQTAKHITVYGDLLRHGLLYAGSHPEPDVAMSRFNRMVSGVVKRLYGAGAVWYPRKGGQNRIIGIDVTDAQHWSEMLAFGGQEWYRFLRETPGVMAVPSSVRGRSGVVQDMVVALVDAVGLIQPKDGSSETAFLLRDAVDYVEQERSQLVALPDGVDHDALLRAELENCKAHGFEFVRGHAGLLSIDDLLAQDQIDFAQLGVVHRVYEMAVVEDLVERSVQFWAVSRSCPTGAKVVLLDGMIKSFATVVEDRLETADGVSIDAVFSAISARKKQAWGLLINGAARLQGKAHVIPQIWDAYRAVLAKYGDYDVVQAGAIEAEATRAAFQKARELGVEIRETELYLVRGGERVLVGTAFVGAVKGVFVDDTTARDEDPDRSGFNGTVLYSADQFGVPYDLRHVKCGRALELSQAAWVVYTSLSSDVRYELDVPVIRLDSDGNGDDPDTSGPVWDLREELESSADAVQPVQLVLPLDFGETQSASEAESASESQSPVIVEVEGDLWEESSRRGLPAVVPVNCVGVMGAGVAKQAAMRYPGLLAAYRSHLAELRAGKSVYLPEYQVVLFPTKYDWRDGSDLGLIASAARSMPCLAVLPRVGAGLGRLDWSDVKRVLLENLPSGEWVVVVPSDRSRTAKVLVVAGTREPSQQQVDACAGLVREASGRGFTHLVHGGAVGIDSVAGSAAQQAGLSVVVVKPVSSAGELSVDDVLSDVEYEEAVELVKRLHPAPHSLVDDVIRYHVRNYAVLKKAVELAGGADGVRVVAYPRWLGGEPTGGTAMTIRLAIHLGIKCSVYGSDGCYRAAINYSAPKA